MVFVLTVVLGLGANAATFALADRLLVTGPSGIARPDEVVRVASVSSRGRLQVALSFPALRAVRDGATSLSSVTGFFDVETPITIAGIEALGDVQLCAGSFARTLGVGTATGRWFGGDEVAESASLPVAVISYSLWQRGYGGASSVLGQTVRVGRSDYTVVGVAPRGFTGIGNRRVDAWLPMNGAAADLLAPGWREDAHSAWISIVARLQRGTPLSLAERQVASIIARSTEVAATRSDAEDRSASLLTIRGVQRESPEGRVAAALSLLALLVYIASLVNAASLLLARKLAGRRDAAIMAALGASDARLATGAFVEVGILVAIGTVLATLVAVWLGRELLMALLPEIASDVGVAHPLGFAMLLGVVGVASLGTVLAVRRGGSKDHLTRSATRQPATGYVWRALVCLQTAVAITLVIVCGLLVQSLQRVQGIQTGMDVDRVIIAASASPAQSESPSALGARMFRTAARVAALPGVAGVALVAKGVPLQVARGISVSLPGMPRPDLTPGEGPYYAAVAHAYFQVVGSKVLAGRTITADDEATGARVAVVTASMAQRYWPSGSPIGSCVLLGDDDLCTRVVGVVEDAIKFRRISETTPFYVYIPITHPFVSGSPPRAIVVRSSTDASDVIGSIQASLRAEPLLGLSAESARSILDPEIRPYRVAARVLLVTAAVALLIAVLGVYAVTAYSVERRRRDYGVMLAIGASVGRIRREIVSETLGIATAGAALGVPLYGSISRLMQSLLYGVSGFDTATLSIAVVLVLASTVLAAGRSLWKVGGIAPTEALRHEQH